MFSMFILPKKEDIEAFLASAEDKLLFAKKEDVWLAHMEAKETRLILCLMFCGSVDVRAFRTLTLVRKRGSSFLINKFC